MMKKNQGVDADLIFSEKDEFEDSRLELPIRKKSLNLLFVGLCLIFMVLTYRLFHLQVVEGSEYKRQSEQNRLNHSVIIADRGIVYDRAGKELIWNEESDGGKEYSTRVYLGVPGLGHILGYSKPPAKDIHGFYYRDSYEGVSGVESQFDDILNGKNGRKMYETNVLGDVVSENLVNSTTPGDNVHLTIDSELTVQLHESIKGIIGQVGYEGGASVIMDVHTGEIVAMTSFPEIRSDILFKGEDEETIEAYSSDPLNPYLNRAVEGAYTPGSIIKPFIGLAALEEGIIGEWTPILSESQLVIPNPYSPEHPSIFRDWRAHGLVDMRHALAVSSNVYFYQIGGGYKNQEGLGIDRIYAYSKKFGFGEKTGIQLSRETSGVVPSREWKREHFEDGEWLLGNTYHTAIGQYGYLVSPIQVVRSVAMIANGGTLVTPVIAEHLTSKKEKVDVDPVNLQIIRQGMRKAVQEGTARGLDYGAAYAFAGKTGTAEVGMTKGYVNSWVIGFFPYENPKYAFATVLEKGPSTNLIGATAAMRNFFDWVRQNRPDFME